MSAFCPRSAYRRVDFGPRLDGAGLRVDLCADPGELARDGIGFHLTFECHLRADLDPGGVVGPEYLPLVW